MTSEGERCERCGWIPPVGGECISCVPRPDQPCERCVFIETPDGACICRVPTEDDVPLWEES